MTNGTAGPFGTEREARETPAVRAVYAAFDADPGLGKMTPHNLRMLLDACTAAGVRVGTFDVRILEWLAGWEPATCAVVAGLITRAAATSPEGGKPTAIRAVLADYDRDAVGGREAMKRIKQIEEGGDDR